LTGATQSLRGLRRSDASGHGGSAAPGPRHRDV